MNELAVAGRTAEWQRLKPLVLNPSRPVLPRANGGEAACFGRNSRMPARGRREARRKANGSGRLPYLKPRSLSSRLLPGVEDSTL